jgi:hypothetical protein
MFERIFKRFGTAKGLQKLTIAELESMAETLASSSDSERTVVTIALAEVKLRCEKCSDQIEQARLTRLESILTNWLEVDRRTLGRGPGGGFPGGGGGICMCATSKVTPAGELGASVQDRRARDQEPRTGVGRRYRPEDDGRASD